LELVEFSNGGNTSKWGQDSLNTTLWGR